MSSRSKRRWIHRDVALAVHEAQIAEHGGTPGVRDLGLLESALARPIDAAANAGASVAELAALYALGVIANHPFADGNKRVGAVLLELFLEENGYRLAAEDAEFTAAILAVAAGELTAQEFTAWVRQSAAPLRRRR